MRPDVHVSDDPAAAAAERLATSVAPGAHLVLTGGSTPRTAYERVAEERPDWSGTEIWFTDERCVPPEHEHSNYGMTKAALLDRVHGAAVHRMPGELGPREGAAAYEREVAGVFGDELPSFDLMLVAPKLPPVTALSMAWTAVAMLSEPLLPPLPSSPPSLPRVMSWPR